MKLRTFGFVAVVLVGLLSVRWLPDASPSAVQPIENHAEHSSEMRTSLTSMRPTFITIHSTDNKSRSADADHALAMNRGLRSRHTALDFSPGISLWTIIPFTKPSRLTKPESMLITKARETGRPSGRNV